MLSKTDPDKSYIFFCFELSVKTVYKIPLFNIYHYIQNVKNRIKDEFRYGIYTYLFLKVNLYHTYLYLACTGIKKNIFMISNKGFIIEFLVEKR